MPLTTLDERTALVLIDLQQGMTWMLGRAIVAPALSQAARLATAFRSQGRPVILVRVAFSADGADRPRNRVELAPAAPAAAPPPDWADLAPELTPAASDIVVTKHQTGAFYGTDLDLQLRRRAITGIVLGGIMTSKGVESTGRAAYDHGYNVTFVADAMTDPDPHAHRHSIATTFPAIGEVDTTAAVLAALDHRPL